MKKRMVALLTAVCLTAAPVSGLAEETDYSYTDPCSCGPDLGLCICIPERRRGICGCIYLSRCAQLACGRVFDSCYPDAGYHKGKKGHSDGKTDEPHAEDSVSYRRTFMRNRPVFGQCVFVVMSQILILRFFFLSD